jgi:large subunit ribosomal protein L35
MPKFKSHSGAKKRFKLTGSGKVKRFHANTSHRLVSKSKKAKLRHLGATTVDVADEARIKRLLAQG